MAAAELQACAAMIAPTVSEQLDALRAAAMAERNARTIEGIRRAEVLDYIRNRLEIFANKAAAARAAESDR